LKGAAAGAAALVAKPQVGVAQQVRAVAAAAGPEALPAQGTGTSPVEVRSMEKPGSDFMVDVFKSLGFEYFFCLPGGGTGIQELVINYGGNKDPRYILVMHEESGA